MTIGLQLERSLFMLHEPVIATVSLTNNSGRDVTLADTEDGAQWFSFQITGPGGQDISPRDLKYQLSPLVIKAGDSVKRSVNLHQIYSIDEIGNYRVRASILFPPTGKYFTSRAYPLNITEGTLLWKQTVGVPDGADGAGTYRNFSLLTMQHERSKSLYVRIEGQNDGVVYGCLDLGPLIADYPPDHQFDRSNNLWVMQLIGQRTFGLSRIGIDGRLLGRDTYVTPKSIPRLRRQADGTLQIVGAYRQDRVAQAPAEVAPKLSDRPAVLPK